VAQLSRAGAWIRTRRHAVFERLAVTPEQIVEYNLPTRPTKPKDTELRYFRQAPVPELPDSVPYADAPESGRADLLPLGIDANGRWITVDLTTDPHILVSGRTGSGKSTEARALVAHVLRHGAQVDICDPRRSACLSSRACRGSATTTNRPSSPP
jgi:Cdc6-like AAA superfamily ATPase